FAQRLDDLFPARILRLSLDGTERLHQRRATGNQHVKLPRQRRQVLEATTIADRLDRCRRRRIGAGGAKLGHEQFLLAKRFARFCFGAGLDRVADRFPGFVEGGVDEVHAALPDGSATFSSATGFSVTSGSSPSSLWVTRRISSSVVLPASASS